MSAKKCKCGNETNEQDGVCVVCKLDIRLGRITPSVNTQDGPVEPNNVGADLSVRPDGGERMKEKDYERHAKCSKEGCIKYAVKEGLCTSHFKEEHGHAPYSKGIKKKEKILAPPEVKIKKKDSGQAGMTEKSTTSAKVSDEMGYIVEQLITKRDALANEMCDIEITLKTLNEYSGIDIPELKLVVVAKLV